MKYRYLLLSAFILTSLSACVKKLDSQPKDFLQPSTYYQTAEQLNIALNGVYDNLGVLYSNPIHFRFGFEGDEAWYIKNAPLSGLHIYDYTASHPDFQSFWNNLYIGIGRANYLLANLNNNPAIDSAVRSKVKGEALFLRAYYYFMLVQSYGGVPLILKPPASINDVDAPRASAKEVYEQIVADMIEAETRVAPITQLGFGGRVNKSAVRGMLARVCLHMAGHPVKEVGRFKDARDWAKKVMDDAEAGHALNPSFSGVFMNLITDKYDIKESLFEVEYWGNRSDAYTETGSLGDVNGPATQNSQTGFAYAGIKATADMYYLYQEGDVRRDWSIASFNYGTASQPANFKIFFTGPVDRATAYNRFPGKYRREYELVLPKNNTATPINCPLMRFADVLLMFAEAENELSGPTAAAIEAVNRVRRRGWSSGIKTVTITNGGAGYTTAPAVTFTGGGGSGIVATAVIANGKVTGVTFANDAIYGTARGMGYTSAPTITFTGGNGSGATATATIYTPADADMPASATAGKEEFRKFIQDERPRELFCETYRKADLIRWGIFVERMHALSATIAKDLNKTSPPYLNLFVKGYGPNISERNTLWPIPTRELTLNRALTQNPGW